MSRVQFSIGAVCAGVLLLCVTFSSSSAQDRRIEAESYTIWGEIRGEMIAAVDCSEASGGRAVTGMDAPGEWISWSLTLAEPYCFTDSLRSAGSTGLVRRYALTFASDIADSIVVSDTLFTPPGRGAG